MQIWVRSFDSLSASDREQAIERFRVPNSEEGYCRKQQSLLVSTIPPISPWHADCIHSAIDIFVPP